ncbi:hypothetical protein LguiA_035168 [Lonicera macranthoides]
MTAALGPGKFYGSSLPRPRIFTDMKLNEERIDPPVPVLDPLLSWAEEAPWSKGGLSTTRSHRLQSRIEGNLKNLLVEPDNFPNERKQIDPSPIEDSSPRGIIRNSSPSTPPAPVAIKRRRRFLGLVDDERELEGGNEGKGNGGEDCVVRNLWDDFNLVAEDGAGKNSGGLVKVSSGRRTSPRLVKPRTSPRLVKPRPS